MTEFMFRFSGSKNTQFFLRLVYYPLWQYWKNFEQATRWRDIIIIYPNHSYSHIIWYSSLHDRVYNLIQWFQKYSVFPTARVLPPPPRQYWQNFKRATRWRDVIIIDPNDSYRHIIWYSSLHDRIMIRFSGSKNTQFFLGSCTTPFCNTDKISNGPRRGVTA